MKEELRTFVLGNFMFGASPEELDDDASLLDTGILDSTGILELIAYLEGTYAIEIAGTEIVPENLDSINRLQAFLARKAGRC
jgi:acyl carrier protein